MALWSDIIDPVEATAIARDEQYVIEQQRGGTLARFLPNVSEDSDHVKFYPGVNSLVDAASYRAFNNPAPISKGQGTKASTIDLPAISRSEPIDETTQKELYNLLASGREDRVRKSIEAAIKRNVQAISQTQERARGIVINTGSLVVNQGDYAIADNFGRDASLSATAGTGAWWSDASVDRLGALTTWNDLYATFNNGVGAGRLVFGSRAAYRAFANGSQFRTVVGTAYRPPSRDEVETYVASNDLPEFEIYDRRVSVNGVLTSVLNPKSVYLLPEPTTVDNEEGSILGATYWGKTVSSTFPSFGIEPDEQPGIVCGVHKEEKVGSSVEVEGDSIGQPVLANPNASMAIQVLQ